MLKILQARLQQYMNRELPDVQVKTYWTLTVCQVSPLCVLSHFSGVWLFATLWTVAYQALLPMGLSSQEYWTGLPCLPPEDLPDPGIKPVSPAAPELQAGYLCWTTREQMFIPQDNPCYHQMIIVCIFNCVYFNNWFKCVFQQLYSSVYFNNWCNHQILLKRYLILKK